MRRRIFAASVMLGLHGLAQTPPSPPFPAGERDDHLPNGKSQRDEILKAEHEKSLKDALELTRLCEELKQDLEREGTFVLSIQTIKKTEEIEKLAKRIRGRLKRT